MGNPASGHKLGAGFTFQRTVFSGYKTDGLMELEPRYCDVIVTRWQNFTGQQARLGESDATFADIEAARKGDEHGTTKLSTDS